MSFLLQIQRYLIIATLLVSGFVSASDGDSEERVWITIDKSVYDHISQTHQALLGETTTSFQSTEDEAIVLTFIQKERISELSHVMHDTFKRCGGFIAYPSYAEAKAAKSAPLKTLGLVGYRIDNADSVQALFNNLTLQRMTDTVEQLASYHDRYYESSTGIDSAQWLASHWTDITAGRADITVEQIRHSQWPQPSVMVSIEGTSLPDEYVIVGGHLDSINSRNANTTRAPGMDDNASGIAVITELLAMIVDSEFYPGRSIKLVGYAAEEVGLLGSREIANSYRAENLNIVGVSQFDMTSYFGTTGADIVFISDYTDAAQNDFMAALMDVYLPDLVYGFDICGYACSDHAAWTNAGYRASFPFEARFQDSNPFIHSSIDDRYDVSHMAKFTHLAASYIAELAKGEAGDSEAKAVLGIQQTSVSVAGGLTVDVVVQRSGRLDEPVTVEYATANGTAVAGTDYTAVSGTLEWLAGDSADKIISIETSVVNSNSLFTLTLGTPSDNSLISSSHQVSVTINGTTQGTNPSPNQFQSTEGGSGSTWLLVALLLLAIFWPEPGRRDKRHDPDEDND